jgi:hypothetical protein
MFAVAAQTTVRATAQVKATKVAAKQQKSAYVHPRFPASFISRRFSLRGAIGGEASARGAETTTTMRARRSRADASRVDASRYRARRPPRRSRASSRVVSERVGCANNSFSGAKTPSSGRDADRKRPRNRIHPERIALRSSISSKAAGAAAALFLFASPALADGLTLQNGTNSAPGKYEQPFYDPRPVVEVEKDSSALISTEGARVAANKQKGAKNCKTITGAPCVAAQDISNQ